MERELKSEREMQEHQTWKMDKRFEEMFLEKLDVQKQHTHWTSPNFHQEERVEKKKQKSNQKK